MINLDEINNTINELEQGETTYDSCQKLASLYMVRKFYNSKDNVVVEFNDIMPSYEKYKDSKIQYQLGKIEKTLLLNNASSLYKEISEFIKVLYTSTDTQAERILLEQMLTNLFTCLFTLEKESA